MEHLERLTSPGPAPAVKPLTGGRVADIAPLVPMALSVELGRVQLSVIEAETLKCGDVVVLDQTIRGLLTARVAGQPKYQGRPGRIGSRLCFAIDSLVEE
jgi:flagellar motor switch protein FliM